MNVIFIKREGLEKKRKEKNKKYREKCMKRKIGGE